MTKLNPRRRTYTIVRPPDKQVQIQYLHPHPQPEAGETGLNRTRSRSRASTSAGTGSSTITGDRGGRSMAILFSVWGCAVFLSVGPEGEEFEEHAEECEDAVLPPLPSLLA